MSFEPKMKSDPAMTVLPENAIRYVYWPFPMTSRAPAIGPPTSALKINGNQLTLRQIAQ